MNTTVSLKPYVYNLPYKGTHKHTHKNSNTVGTQLVRNEKLKITK